MGQQPLVLLPAYMQEWLMTYSWCTHAGLGDTKNIKTLRLLPEGTLRLHVQWVLHAFTDPTCMSRHPSSSGALSFKLLIFIWEELLVILESVLSFDCNYDHAANLEVRQYNNCSGKLLRYCANTAQPYTQAPSSYSFANHICHNG